MKHLGRDKLILKGDGKTDKLMCEVCGKNEAIGVAGCTLCQPCSHAYCQRCVNQSADPLWCFLATIEICGGPSNLAPWVNRVQSYDKETGKYISFEEVTDRFFEDILKRKEKAKK